MAGGIGSRFWPYSRNDRPKQFLDFFGTGRSLLQLTVDRLLPIADISHILIVTNARYKSIILEQLPTLPERNILCEPCRRNTAPCIAYAVSHIAALTDNANILIAASDHLITDTDTFRRKIEEGLDAVGHHDILLTLGMTPTRPETGYGYIHVDARHRLGTGPAEIYKVEQFKEKPDIATAKHFLEQGGFLWNSGMFVFNLQTIISAFKTHLPQVWEVFEQSIENSRKATDFDEQEYINTHFAECEGISIDYGVMEKADNVYVMAADFGWSDVGTWGSLYELSDKDDKGNVVINAEADFYDSRNNIVTLEKGKLAVVEGLDDYIVAESDGVLLICRKQNEQQIRQFVANAKEKFL